MKERVKFYGSRTITQTIAIMTRSRKHNLQNESTHIENQKRMEVIEAPTHGGV